MAEKQPAQRLIMLCTSIGFVALLAVSGFDRRSRGPPCRSSALILIAAMIPCLIWRLLDEERFLATIYLDISSTRSGSTSSRAVRVVVAPASAPEVTPTRASSQGQPFSSRSDRRGVRRCARDRRANGRGTETASSDGSHGGEREDHHDVGGSELGSREVRYVAKPFLSHAISEFQAPRECLRGLFVVPCQPRGHNAHIADGTKKPLPKWSQYR